MPLVGDILAGRYRIDAALGAGGTAVVYRARDLRLERDVAVKVLLPNLARDPLVAGRFDREARGMAAASHPGIVAVYDVDPGDPTSGREPFFVMELCDDGSLADALEDAGGRLPPDELVPMLVDVADGLANLHRRGVIHRDIKPHNILLCDGAAKLADFGLARAQDTTRLSAPGTAAGTLAYLAPELLAGVEPGPASDVYALGVVAFQGLTGRLPRPAGSMVDMVDARRTPIAPLSSVAPDLGPAFDAPIAAALATDPNRRPTALDFGTAMARSLSSWRANPRARVRPPAVPRPTDSTQQVPLAVGAGGRRGGSNRGPWVAASAFLLLLLLIAVALSLSGAFGGRGPGPTRGPSASTSVSPSAPSTTPTGTASPTPTPTSTPTPSPSESASPSLGPTPTPPPTAPPDTPAPTRTPVRTPGPIVDYQAARQNLANVNTAIDSAIATSNLAPADAADLTVLTGDIDRALQVEDATAARASTRELSNLVEEMISDGRLTNGQEIQNAVANLANSLGLRL